MNVRYLLLATLICPVLVSGQTSAPSERAQEHSKQVHGGNTPGQIPYLLAHSSGDVHLPSPGIVDKIMPPDATSVLESMTCDSGSDVVVLGTLSKGTSSPTTDQGYIYTDWDLTVAHVFKNVAQTSIQPGETIVVTRPGGELTTNGRHVYAVEDDFPRFHVGEEVLLYLRSLPVGTYALSSPNGFFLSRSKVIPIDKLFAPKFANIQRDTFLQLVQSEATASCPVPATTTGGKQ